LNTSLVKQEILESLKADPEYRHAWNFENVYLGICFQLRALREQRNWSQAALGNAARMAQERISILEDPNANTKPTLNTLLRIADAFDVGLDVRFVPYKTVLDRSTKTDMGELEVPSFEEELPQLERAIALESDMGSVAYSDPFKQFGEIKSSASFMVQWRQISKMSVGREELKSGDLHATVHDQLDFASYPNVVAYIDESQKKKSPHQSKVA
jgi:transcriptional regulator with XRE-family HTH domain